MSKIVNADNKRVIPPSAPLAANELVQRLPYGPVNGVEAGFDPSDVVKVVDEGEWVTVAESDRRKEARERLKEKENQ